LEIILLDVDYCYTLSVDNRSFIEINLKCKEQNMYLFHTLFKCFVIVRLVGVSDVCFV